jgi:hypothetical protein
MTARIGVDHRIGVHDPGEDKAVWQRKVGAARFSRRSARFAAAAARW